MEGVFVILYYSQVGYSYSFASFFFLSLLFHLIHQRLCVIPTYNVVIYNYFVLALIPCQILL